MYWRNCGSNWPRSCALIARSTRGSALIGPGPIRSRGAGFRSSTMRMVLQPEARDVDAPRHPCLLSPDVLEKAFQRCEAARASDEPAVQADRHHPALFGVEHVEGILQIGKEVVAGIEALRSGEAHVVRIERVGHDELRLTVTSVVPRQVVVVVVRVVEKAAVFHHETARIGAGAPGV